MKVLNFLEIFFATRSIEEVDELLITYFLMSTKLRDRKVDYEELSTFFRCMMEQFIHYLLNKFFSNEVENESDFLEDRLKMWSSTLTRGLIPNNVYVSSWMETF